MKHTYQPSMFAPPPIASISGEAHMHRGYFQPLEDRTDPQFLRGIHLSSFSPGEKDSRCTSRRGPQRRPELVGAGKARRKQSGAGWMYCGGRLSNSEKPGEHKRFGFLRDMRI